MKTVKLILFGLFFCLKLQAQTDTLNICVLNDIDTVEVQSSAELFDCNYLISTEKSHNKCYLKFNDSLFTGRIYYRLPTSQDSYEVFDGKISDGLILQGTILRYSLNGQLTLTGQYNENWKYGIWTTFYTTGEIESVMKFIKYADDPVIEWVYDKKGNLTYHNDEQKEIEERIKNTNH